MSKPKYCSWDVRDLASDYNTWTEISDQRDISQLKFKYHSAETNYSELCISLETGNVSIINEDSDFIRTVLFCDTCLEFTELEKVFQLRIEELMSKQNNPKIINKMTSDKRSKKIISKTSHSNTSDGFDLMNNLLQKWDEDEVE